MPETWYLNDCATLMTRKNSSIFLVFSQLMGY